MRDIVSIACFVSAMTLSLGANGYEFESAVPLTIDSKLDNQEISNISVHLNDNKVSISADIDNNLNFPFTDGFFAYTPIFKQLGDGEENYDKSFSDFNVSIDAKPVRLSVNHRAFFLGKDITAELIAAGIDPLPSQDNDPEKITKVPPQFGITLKDGRDWEGLVTFSWITTVNPASKAKIEIRYRAIPQFGVENIAEQRFSQLIREHCGDSERIIKQIIGAKPSAKTVLLERYAVPVLFINRKALTLTVSQAKTSPLGGHPLLALACGLTAGEGLRLPASGELKDVDGDLSILIVSLPASD
jgi:Domain of unknown function (DUF4424)